jgi:hypothetical protein
MIKMDEKDIRIVALSQRIEGLEKDREVMIKHIKYLGDQIVETYSRDAECPYCRQKHWEIHENACF